MTREELGAYDGAADRQEEDCSVATRIWIFDAPAADLIGSSPIVSEALDQPARTSRVERPSKAT
jgi:hypothetical protein